MRDGKNTNLCIELKKRTWVQYDPIIAPHMQTPKHFAHHFLLACVTVHEFE